MFLYYYHYFIFLYRPKVVSAQWLLDGLKQGAQVNEADYSVLDIPDVLHTMSPQAKPR